MKYLKCVIPLFFVIFLLIACTDETKSTDLQQTAPDTAVEEETLTEENEVDTQQEPVAPTSCEGITFETNAIIDGQQLATCMVDAMLLKQTGSHIVTSGTGEQTTVDFEWSPNFSMHSFNDNMSVIIKEDTGWFKNAGGQWIEEDETNEDPESAIATGVIKLTRAFSHPSTITQFLTLNSSWKVHGKEQVPASEAFINEAWKLIPDAPITLEGLTISDVELWLSDAYLGAYYVSTITVAGITETTSNTFTQWGEPVTIPSPN